MSTASPRLVHPALERMTRLEIQSLQLERLRRQLTRLAATNPFFATRWREAGVDVDEVRSLEDIRRLPVVTKEDVLADQVAASPYGTRLGVDPRDVFELTLSSGTSGNLQEVHAHTVRDAHLRAMHGIAFRWAGLEADETLVFHVGISNSASHGPFHRGIRSIGRLPYLVGHLGFPQRLELMERFGVDHMYAMPSALNGLAQLCEEQGRPARDRFPGLRSIVMSGEGWPVDFVERMEESWGARIHEGYGASQTYGGFVMSSCERGAVTGGRRNGMHFYEWAILLEVLDPESLEPVAPGEVGELVVTHLEKEASPLVRFRTRDRVRHMPWTECPCGRQLDMIESGTIGRWDDMVKVKGQNVFPTEVDEIVFARPEIGEYQARVFIGASGRDVAEMRVGIVRGHPDDPAVSTVLDGLSRELKAATNVSFELRPVPLDDLPRYTTPDAKPRRWTDERQADLGRRG